MDDDMRKKLKDVSQQYQAARERNEAYKYNDTRGYDVRRTDTLEERRLEFEEARLQYIIDKDRYTP
jgi:hypothetical protein